MSIDDSGYESPDDFLQRIEAGELDGSFPTEIGKLSREQLNQIARVLLSGKKVAITSLRKRRGSANLKIDIG
jgi:hypothetical protein